MLSWGRRKREYVLDRRCLPMRSERDARCIPPVASPSFFLHCLPIVFLPALPTQQNHYATARGLGCNPYNGRMEGCGSETRVSGRPCLPASSTHRQLNHTTTRVQNCRIRFSAALTRRHGLISPTTILFRTAYHGRLLFFGDVDLVRYRGKSPFTSAHPSNLQLVQFSALHWVMNSSCLPRPEGEDVPCALYISLPVAPQSSTTFPLQQFLQQP